MRHKVAIESRVLVTAIGRPGSSIEKYSFFRARTVDISITGIGLAMHQSDVEDFCGLGSKIILKLNLHLPKATIEIEAEPVRYALIPHSLPQSVLIGARIIKIPGICYEIYSDYIYAFEPTS